MYMSRGERFTVHYTTGTYISFYQYGDTDPSSSSESSSSVYIDSSLLSSSGSGSQGWTENTSAFHSCRNMLYVTMTVVSTHPCRTARVTQDSLIKQRDGPAISILVITSRIVHDAHRAEEHLSRRRGRRCDRPHRLRGQLERLRARGRGGRAVDSNVALDACGEEVRAIGVHERSVHDGLVACVAAG